MTSFACWVLCLLGPAGGLHKLNLLQLIDYKWLGHQTQNQKMSAVCPALVHDRELGGWDMGKVSNCLGLEQLCTPEVTKAFVPAAQ